MPKFISMIVAASMLPMLAAPAAAQQPHRLSLQEAIQKGLQHNLRVLLAETNVSEAEGTSRRRFAELLPRAKAEAAATVQNRSLAAFGINAPGIPEVVGPFSTYDLRASVEQPLFDLQRYQRWKAGEKLEEASRQDYQDVRDLVIRHVAALYLNAQAADARVEAARSRVTTAEALFDLARDRHDSGVATGVDVLRAQVELAHERQQLLELANNAEQSRLELARAIGFDLARPIELADPLDFKAVALPDVPNALSQALAERPDYLAMENRREAVERDERSARARYLPKLNFSANYGGIGRNFGDLRGTGAVAGTLSFTLFDWDRRGELDVIAARKERLRHEMDDLRVGIEQEIRKTRLDLQSAAEQVKVAREGRDLAGRELELARDRFQAGVADNVEVISAQEAVARAEENLILALTRHADARIALARALGATENIYGRYLGIAP